jgi:hypothetical protein
MRMILRGRGDFRQEGDKNNVKQTARKIRITGKDIFFMFITRIEK